MRSPVVPIEDVLNALPQTQCGRCGFGGCRPYAEAIVEQQAPLDRCPPGGEVTLKRLSELTQRPQPQQVDPELGPCLGPQIAFILEDQCIGCMKCIQACPVDAIVGAPKKMHTVLAADCTGCALCIAPCPMDCIELKAFVPAPTADPWPAPLGPVSRARFEYKENRAAQKVKNREQSLGHLNPEDLLRSILGDPR